MSAAVSESERANFFFFPFGVDAVQLAAQHGRNWWSFFAETRTARRGARARRAPKGTVRVQQCREVLLDEGLLVHDSSYRNVCNSTPGPLDLGLTA